MYDWKLFQKHAQKYGSAVSVLLNSLVIHLVLNKSPKQLGAYKNLIILTASFEFTYSILEVLVQPIFHSFGSTFSLIVDVQDSYLSYQVLKVLLAFYCAFFGSLLALFSIQFIYRYWAVSGNERIRTFKGYQLLWWLLAPITNGGLWWCVGYFTCAPRPSSDNYLRESVMKEFGLDVTENVYVAPYFYEVNLNGTTDIYYPSFISIIFNFMTVNISVCTVFYFGFKCYASLRNLTGTRISQKARGLQNQLFYSLVAQTLIPLILMHIPAFAMYVLTFLKVEIGSLTGVVTVTIAIFPAIDPLPTLFIVKNYRQAIQIYIYSFFNAIAKLFHVSKESSNAIEMSCPKTV